MKNLYLPISCFIISLNLACAQQENPPNIELSDESDYYIEKIVDGIDIPWGMTFINNNEFLVSDRDGLLYHVKNGEKTAVKGLPEIHYNGLIDCFTKVLTQEGPFAFYRGFLPIWGRFAPQATLQLVVFEQLLKFTKYNPI